MKYGKFANVGKFSIRGEIYGTHVQKLVLFDEAAQAFVETVEDFKKSIADVAAGALNLK